MRLSASRVVLIAAAFAFAVPSASYAQGAHASSAVELARQAETLKPGDWVWAPEIAPSGPVTVYVDLSEQVATVYRNGVRIGVSTVSSGKPGHETPTGVFTILQKDKDHRSSTYNNAPMPYQERLTWEGVALHAGGLPGYPESHGCIHLPMEFSKLLFGTTDLGGTVIVAGRAGQPMKVPAAGVIDASDGLHQPLAADEPYRWNPELSPTGPITVILSRADQRAVVMRNGVEIGRARVEVPTTDFETHVLMYTEADAVHPHWIYMGVPGHDTEQGKPLDTTVMSHVRMPAQFQADVKAALSPGATVLVTNSSILPDTTGKHLTVLASAGGD